MSSEWPLVSLKEVTSVLGDGLHGTPEYDPYGDHFFINGNNLSSGKIIFSAATKRVSATEAAKHKKNLTDRTILVSINGTLGKVAFYAGEKVVLGKSACYFNVVDSVDKHFIRYVLDNEVFQGYIHNLASGSTIKNVSLKLMRDFQFRLPPIPVQQRIAGVLKALDDRITLLRETNTTLEAIAQALFKSWFVDFDPVHAKMQGRAPEGMDEATAALFPDSFGESELGDVPKGWSTGKLADIASLKGGKMLDKTSFSDSGANPVFGGAGVMGFSDLSNSEGFVITVGRVGAYCGQYFWHQGRAWVNNNASLVSPINPDDSCWLFLWLKNVDMDLIKKGAAQPFVSNGDISDLKIVLPPGFVVDKFVQFVEPIFQKLSLIREKTQSLEVLRDTLLPRLISGQLQLPKAGQFEESLA